MALHDLTIFDATENVMTIARMVDRAGFEPAAFRFFFRQCEPDVLWPLQQPRAYQAELPAPTFRKPARI